MKLFNIPDFTLFQMLIIVVITFILSAITFSIAKSAIFSVFYNMNLNQFDSVDAKVIKCDLLVDTWTTKSKRSSAMLSYPVFRPVYHVEYTLRGKTYNGEIKTSVYRSFKTFREVHKELSKIVGMDSISIISYDTHEWSYEDILYIINKEYISSFPKAPSHQIVIKFNPKKPQQIGVGEKQRIHTFETITLLIVSIVFFLLLWIAPNYSNATKNALSISIICIALLTGFFLNNLLDKLPPKKQKYSFAIGPTIEVDHLKNYISEGVKEELHLK